jgi:hypothetical protein
MRLVQKRSIVVYLTEATEEKNAELVFVSHRQGNCKILDRKILDFSYSSKYSGTNQELSLNLHKPVLVALFKYLMLFPDPENSAEYYLFITDKLMSPPYMLNQPSKTPLRLPNIQPPIHPSIHITRAKQDHFNILVPVLNPETNQISSIKGLEVLFEKDRTEELNGFKMPLMFVGVGVAFAYQLCCKGTERRKTSRSYSKYRNTKYDRRERMTKLNKRISQLESSFN